MFPKHTKKTLSVFPVRVINYISVYELSRLCTLFLDSFILLLDPKPLHVSAVFCFSHRQVATKLKDLVTQIFNTKVNVLNTSV